MDDEATWKVEDFPSQKIQKEAAEFREKLPTEHKEDTRVIGVFV